MVNAIGQMWQIILDKGSINQVWHSNYGMRECEISGSIQTLTKEIWFDQLTIRFEFIRLKWDSNQYVRLNQNDS